MSLTFDAASGRYRDSATGRYLSEQAVRRVVDQIADGASERLAALSRQMLAGELSLAEWQAGAMRTIKLAHVATATIAHGGQARMTFGHYGSVGQDIRSHYQFLRGFAEQIASGEQPLTDGLIARARQYGQASRVTFERAYGQDQQRRGFQSCRNILGAAEHCAQCREQTARGWVPAGSLVPIGSRTCRGNCRCRIAYSREAARAA